jgi:hypothetical protein
VRKPRCLRACSACADPLCFVTYHCCTTGPRFFY